MLDKTTPPDKSRDVDRSTSDRRWAVVSPHLDDAAFSCGEWLTAHPHTLVVTVFAGVPADTAQLTSWDADCGFRSAGQAMQARRAEDEKAMNWLDAAPAWLDFCDSQYGQPATPQQVAAGLSAILHETPVSDLLVPLGLFHSDHVLVHEAAMLASRRLRGVTVFAYEDALYRAMPGLLQQRLAELATMGVRATPAPVGRVGKIEYKRRAVECYASQIKAFGTDGLGDLWCPERLWKLEADFADR